MTGSYAQQLGAAADSLRELTAYRNKLIFARRDQGASLRQIAIEARLSHAAVAKILKRGTP